MDPIAEIETLRAQLQRRHREHLQIDLDIAKTFSELARVEKQSGRKEDSGRTLLHFHQAIEGVRKGMGRVADLSQDERHAIEAEIAKLEAAIKGV